MRRNPAPVLALALCCAATGCGGHAAPSAPLTAQRDVAQRFARAIFHGNAGAAHALLADPRAAGLSWLVTRSADGWRAHHGTVRLPGQRAGARWTFGFAGTRTHKDGRFERLRGHILVVVEASSQRPGVTFFAYRMDAVRFSTHHDSVLMPSNR
jgi:hypothetical protein